MDWQVAASMGADNGRGRELSLWNGLWLGF